ncbi:MAG: GHMP kinase [Thiotrichales bacterium]|nr:GHMP kinase [Thiotrichales bacterium]
MNWSSSAPANLMLIGEHSVVHGYPAIAMSVSQRLTLDWQTRDDMQISIESSLGNFLIHLDKLHAIPEDSAFKWILYPIRNLRRELDKGFNIKVTSEFEHTLGLGSSAAVLAATLGGLHFYLNKSYGIIETFRHGLKVIHQIQGRGSGTDLAASLAGGVILFDPKKQTIIPVDASLPATLVYSGYKTPTAKVLDKVHRDWLYQPDILKNLYKIMGKVTSQAFDALQRKEMSGFYQLINTYQGLMDALGVNDDTLGHIVYQLRSIPGVQASKISGSGLGDCVLGLGMQVRHHDNALADYQHIEIETDYQGMTVEQID